MEAETVERVLDALVHSRVPYSVLRGAEPTSGPRSDVDLLVPGEAYNTQAVGVVRGVLESCFDVVVTCLHVDVPVVWAANRSDPDSICEWDISSAPLWALGPLLDPWRVVAESSAVAGVMRPRPGDRSALFGVPALLGNRNARTNIARRLPEVLEALERDPDGAQRAWAEALASPARARALLARIRADSARLSPGDLARLRSTVMFRRFSSHPLRGFRRLADVLVLRERRARCGLWLANGTSLQPVRNLKIGREAWRPVLESVVAAH